MRFKLVLSVKSESFGSVLPVSYQYELSAAVYRRIRENFELYLHWLSSNGFAPIDDCRNRLFSFSNLYIPRIRVEYDRLHILVKRVQMWISFLPVRGTHEFVKQLFSGETFVLGDRRSRVELEVEDIVECPAPGVGEEAEYLALSPIVFMVARPNFFKFFVGFFFFDKHQLQAHIVPTILHIEIAGRQCLIDLFEIIVKFRVFSTSVHSRIQILICT